MTSRRTIERYWRVATMLNAVMFFVGLGCGTLLAYHAFIRKMDDLEIENVAQYKNGFVAGKAYADRIYDRKKRDEIYEIRKYREELDNKFSEIKEVTRNWEGLKKEGKTYGDKDK